jgi:hypothetical protein
MVKGVIVYILSTKMTFPFWSACDNGCCIKIITTKEQIKYEFGGNPLQKGFFFTRFKINHNIQPKT